MLGDAVDCRNKIKSAPTATSDNINRQGIFALTTTSGISNSGSSANSTVFCFFGLGACRYLDFAVSDSSYKRRLVGLPRTLHASLTAARANEKLAVPSPFASG
ncbi:unannotated protein [freshwater metagenome]|uniref:Unannotated protein n=1 Tax=freshwater metagenome TaxID=449393 RepID=A0A6J7NTB2_9ZZZZ